MLSEPEAAADEEAVVLAALGLRPAAPERVDRLLLALLRSGESKVTAGQQAELSAELDPPHLGDAPAAG